MFCNRILMNLLEKCSFLKKTLKCQIDSELKGRLETKGAAMVIHGCPFEYGRYIGTWDSPMDIGLIVTLIGCALLLINVQ